MRQIVLFITLLAYINTSAQSYAKEDLVYISVMQPERTEIPSEARTQLENKMNQLLMQNGIASDDPNNRFILTTKASIITRDIVSGPPTKVSMNIDFTFIIGDAEENAKFESCTISTTGVGINDNKAFIAAIKNIKPQNRELVAFVHNAKEKVVQYYERKCEQIKTEASREAASRYYDKAVYMLMQVPNVCDCADDCQQLAIQYCTEKLNNEAEALLSRAKAVWAASPGPKGASDAAEVLAEIPANTASQSGINALIAEIKGKLKADEMRAWNFKMKQYNDRIEKQQRDDAARLEQQRADNTYRLRQQTADNERRRIQQIADNEYRSKQQVANNEYRKTQQAADNDARSQTIEAARQVGLAYAKNQPQSVTYQRNVVLW